MRVRHRFELSSLRSLQRIILSLKPGKFRVVPRLDTNQPVHGFHLLCLSLYPGPVSFLFLVFGALAVYLLLVEGNKDLMDTALLKLLVDFSINLTKLLF